MNRPTPQEVTPDHLGRARGELLRQADGLDDAGLRTRPADDAWSVIEVLAHLVAVDEHWLGEALAIRANPAHTFIPFDDDRWKATHRQVRERPLAEILDDLDRSHTAVRRALAQLSPADLARAGRHPRGTPYTVRAVFERYLAHDRAHAEQIAAIRAQLGRE